MTAAAAPVMHGPDGMRLFLVAAHAAIIAAPLAASTAQAVGCTAGLGLYPPCGRHCS